MQQSASPSQQDFLKPRVTRRERERVARERERERVARESERESQERESLDRESLDSESLDRGRARKSR